MPPTFKSKKTKLNSSLNDCLINEEVLTYLDARAKLSEEELSRSFTQTELKLLCEKYKCKVDMWKWNPADEMREKLEEDGRFRNRSSKYCLRLIAKGVTKHKTRLMYDCKDIEKIRQEEWGLRKRDCIQYLEEHSSESALLALGDMNNSCTQIPATTNCMYDSADVFTDVEPYTQSDEMEQEIPNGCLQEHFQELISTPEKIQLQECFVTSSQSGPLTQLNSEDIRELNANGELCDLLNINTGSLTLKSDDDILTEVPQKSEDINSANYEDFNKQIPFTSTQSQSQSQELE